MTRRYDKAFKEQAMQMVTELQKPVAEVARDLGIPDTTLHQWLKNHREHPEAPYVFRVYLFSSPRESSRGLFGFLTKPTTGLPLTFADKTRYFP